jgi:hypothetical protein
MVQGGHGDLRYVYRWDDSARCDIMSWINLAHHRKQWCVSVKTLISFRLQSKEDVGEFKLCQQVWFCYMWDLWWTK